MDTAKSNLLEACKDVEEAWSTGTKKELATAVDTCLLAIKAATKKRTKKEAAYFEQAKELWHRDGECEIDSDAVVSVSDDGGAYVQAWVWVADK